MQSYWYLLIRLKEVIVNIRNIRKEKNIPNKEQMELFLKKNNELDTQFDAVISKLGNLSAFEYTEEKVDNAFSFIVNSNEYFVPFGESIDVEAERAKLEEELKYTQGFLKSVQKKLSNERFVNNAPDAVIAGERKKQEDAQMKINVIEEKLTTLV